MTLSPGWVLDFSCCRWHKTYVYSTRLAPTCPRGQGFIVSYNPEVQAGSLASRMFGFRISNGIITIHFSLHLLFCSSPNVNQMFSDDLSRCLRLTCCRKWLIFSFSCSSKSPRLTWDWAIVVWLESHVHPWVSHFEQHMHAVMGLAGSCDIPRYLGLNPQPQPHDLRAGDKQIPKQKQVYDMRWPTSHPVHCGSVKDWWVLLCWACTSGYPGSSAWPMLALGCWLPGVAGGRFQLISTAGSQLQRVRGAPGRAGVTVAWPMGLDLGIAVIISSPVAAREALYGRTQWAVVRRSEPKIACSLRPPEEAWPGC